MSATALRRPVLIAAAAALTLWLPAAAIAQQPLPSVTTLGLAQFDQAQCIAEAERFGAALAAQIERELRPGETRDLVKGAAEGVKALMRSTCAGMGSMTTPESLAAIERLSAEVQKMAQALQAAAEGRALTPEQRETLDALAKPLVREFGALFSRLREFDLDAAWRSLDSLRRFERFCVGNLFCVVPAQPNSIQQ